ncbi:MAG: hypothetical protein K0S18_364 [Anaerocolumna sp.]|jgi:phage-related minor tail protein|nr:hypothetical protein [Anaerocolumna sp.]
MADGRVEYEIRGDDSKLDEDLDRAHGKVEKSSSKLGTVAGASAKAIGAGFVAAGAAAIGVGIAAVNSANDMDKAMNGFIASTGKGTEEAERYQGILEDIYTNNYGESFEDIATNMALVTQQMGEMSDADLQKTVESAYLLSDTFGIDIQESIRGANAMMNQFGIDSETAYNMMAQGAQAGLNQNGDLADQIAEYSVYYAQMGLSVEDMMNAMANGVESGAYQVDYLNDAMKEFGIRSKDGSDTSRAAFEALGLNADDMFKKFAEGGEGSKEAFKLVTDELLNMDDKVQQDAIGVALFGTKWEDTGVQAITALTDMGGAIDSTTDKLSEIEDVKYDSLGEMFEGLKRSVEMLLLPLGEMLIPMLSEIITAILPVLEEMLPPLIELFGGVFEQLLPMVEEILPVLIELFQELAPPVMELIEKLLPVLLELAQTLLPIFLQLIDLLMPIIDLFIELLEPILDLISQALAPLLEALIPLISTLSDILVPLLKVVLSVFVEVFKGIAENVTDRIKAVTKILTGIIDFIKGVFTGDWKLAWEGIKGIFEGIVGGLASIFKAPLNIMIDGINGFIKGVNSIKIPDWVPVVGGKGFSIPTIPRLRVGMDYVPSDDFPALLHKGEAVLTAQENGILQSLGGIRGLYDVLSQPSTKAIQNTVIVENMAQSEPIDYELLGQETVRAFANSRIGINVDGREFGRVIDEVTKERR